MHLTTVHNSNYYSGAPSTANMTNMTSTVHCLNTSVTSRIMRHCRPCTSMNGTNATALHVGPSSTHDFALLARNVDSRESQGTHTMVTVGIILGVAFGCLCVAAILGWAVKLNKAAFAKSQGRRAHVVSRGNGGSSSEKDYTEARRQAYQGDGGLNAPPRSARSNGPRFPSARFGCDAARSGRSQSKHSSGRQAKGPYQDDTPFSATPSFEARGGSGRNQYSNGRSQRS